MAKLTIGDVIEIPIKGGYSYAQYTHKHKLFGALLQVRLEVFPTRPEDVIRVLQCEPAFCCFFPLDSAVKHGDVTVIGNFPIPAGQREFPVFRAGVVDPATQRVQVWWLWDGEKEWRVGNLTDDQRRLSIRGVWNDTLLIERIESGWRPETDPT